ncbi:uncharacterized protein LOC143722468 [Siphateles boraxobius]|uniref:uncharacterized protein LOC143722468 n=1 Tax=Siphateles boraxobius TaxID=180520 RepID=UPI004064072C
MGDRRVVLDVPPGNHSLWAPHPSLPLLPLEPPVLSAGPSVVGGPAVSLGAPLGDRMSIAASEGELMSGDDDSAALSPSGSSMLPEPDPELSAMLKRAAEAVGLEWNPPPCPVQSRLDDWYLGAGRAGSQPAAPVPFFPEVHEELTWSWTAPFTAENDLSSSSSLTTLVGGAVKGYEAIPPVERSVATHLCPTAAASWVGDPCFPSRACEFASGLAVRAYRACGQAASSLHALALLQVYQAKTLMDMHEGSLDRALVSELRTATDLALRGTSVAACAVGLAMSTLVVQERHRWLSLVEMADADKVRFLDSPISQVGLFGDVAESCAQQFSATQVRTEAPRHTLSRRPAVASTLPPGIVPPPVRRRGRPPAAASGSAGSPQQPTPRPQRRTSSRQAAQSVSVTAQPGGECQKRS